MLSLTRVSSTHHFSAFWLRSSVVQMANKPITKLCNTVNDCSIVDQNDSEVLLHAWLGGCNQNNRRDMEKSG